MSNSNNHPRHKTGARSGKTTRLGRLAEKLLGPALAARGFSHHRIITEWPRIAGDAAQWSEPATITFPKGQTRDGTLVVNIRSGRGPEMQMLIPSILEQCNAVFGYQAVSRITITQVAMEQPGQPPPPAPAPAPAASPGDPPALDAPDGISPELHKALDNLGKSLARGKRR